MNGMRPLLTEIQALVSESPFAGNPRRIAIGFDNYRLSMLISIIEKKLKLPFYKSDVFLNITGGMVIREPAADLAVCSALISSYKNISPQAQFGADGRGRADRRDPADQLPGDTVERGYKTGFFDNLPPGRRRASCLIIKIYR